MFFHPLIACNEYQIWDDVRSQKLPEEFSVTFPQEVNYHILIKHIVVTLTN